MNSAQPVIILFDGVCNLCNGAVQFIIRRDPGQRFRFASLQSAAGQELLQRYGVDATVLYSIMVIDDGVLYQRSDAALRIARYLSGLWPVLAIFRILPRPFRDAVYNYIATHRYKWFGKREACMIPTPDMKTRFLE